MADNKSRVLKVDVDVTEALTGLKALQREAKKATQELRELEDISLYSLKSKAVVFGALIEAMEAKGISVPEEYYESYKRLIDKEYGETANELVNSDLEQALISVTSLNNKHLQRWI